LDGIVFTNADPRYAGKLDDLQGGDTTMLVQQVREVITVNQEMTDISSWIWLTSEQMGFPLRSEFVNENHGEAGSSKQCNDQRTDQTAFFLVPIITDFIRNTKRELYDEKLEDALEMLDLEWSKDDDIKTQCNWLNTSPPNRGNASNKNGPARVKRQIQWEAASKPLAVDNPLLLPEREVLSEIGINWFLDREIPKGGYVRILAESLLWEERPGKTRIKTIQGLTTCMEPHRGCTTASSSWNFLQKRWLDREQDLITVIQQETKLTEENEEAGYRLPTWSILRALQKINKAKRLEGEAVMSAPPFFQSAGRGDLKFWGEDDGPDVVTVVWENLSELEQEQWSKKMGKSKDWVVWCRLRKKDQEQRLFEVYGKEIFSNRIKQAKPKAGEKTDKKGGKGQSVRWKAWRRQGNIKCAVSEEYASCWVHQDCHVAYEQKAVLKKAAGVSGGKDECQVRLKGRERDDWIGTETDMLGGYGFQGQVTAGDGSDKQGKMGAGYNNLRGKTKKQQCKVGCEEKGSSSNRHKLARFYWRFVTR